jgi:hypothetical protein
VEPKDFVLNIPGQIPIAQPKAVSFEFGTPSLCGIVHEEKFISIPNYRL